MNTYEQTKSSSGKSKVGPVIAVLIAAIIIGSAIFVQTRPVVIGADIAVPAVTEKDHVRGDVNAPVKIIEYSDLECPYCQQFHATMQQVAKEYVDTGKVAWIYRHFPLTQIHPDALPLAIASECVAQQGGDTAFWKFIDGVFGGVNGQAFKIANLYTLVRDTGVNNVQFSSCYNMKKTEGLVTAQAGDAQTAGASGTPFSVVISAKGNKYTIPGAYPLAEVKAVIESALAERPAPTVK